MSRWTREAIEAAAVLAAGNLGYPQLLPEQKEFIASFVEGQDVFVSLPTGYGKMLCFGALPGTYDHLRGSERRSVVVVVSPLIALMEEQVAFFQERGLSAVHVSPGGEKSVEDEQCQLVFVSPEMLLCNRRCRNMLRSEMYIANLCGVVIDEAHCVTKWLAKIALVVSRGNDFRKEFARLHDVRSLLPPSVNMMALTATASRKNRDIIMKTLGMHRHPKMISICPCKQNISYHVTEFITVEESFRPIAQSLRRHSVSAGRIIIFCPTVADCAELYLYFKNVLGLAFLHPPGAPDKSKYRLVEVFHSVLELSHKQTIVASFSSTASPLRLVIATVAFGMGINCPNVRQVIHYGCPEDVDTSIQETGRAGRDGQPASALLLSRRRRAHIKEDMANYLKLQDGSCRRDYLFKDYDDYRNNATTPCSCCDLCKLSCTCRQCS